MFCALLKQVVADLSLQKLQVTLEKVLSGKKVKNSNVNG